MAFGIHRCSYLGVLTVYGLPELALLYCKMDDLMYELLLLTMTWEHTKTLDREDDPCDLRWCRRVEEAQ